MTITITDDINIGMEKSTFTLSELFRYDKFQEAYEDYAFGQMIQEGDTGNLVSDADVLIALRK